MSRDRTILEDLIERLLEIVQSEEHDGNIREFVESAARDAAESYTDVSRGSITSAASQRTTNRPAEVTNG